MREHYHELLTYVQKIESKYGTVSLMNKRERNYMLKLSYPCYKNEFASLNQYEMKKQIAKLNFIRLAVTN